jgi:hypothetical protein
MMLTPAAAEIVKLEAVNETDSKVKPTPRMPPVPKVAPSDITATTDAPATTSFAAPAAVPASTPKL